MASIDGKYLDEDGFSLYSALLGHYLYLKSGGGTTELIDSLFIEENNNNTEEENNNGD